MTPTDTPAETLPDAIDFISELLALMPSMQWLIEQGVLSRDNAPKFAKVVGDAYMFLEKIDIAAHKEAGG